MVSLLELSRYQPYPWTIPQVGSNWAPLTGSPFALFLRPCSSTTFYLAKKKSFLQPFVQEGCEFAKRTLLDLCWCPWKYFQLWMFLFFCKDMVQNYIVTTTSPRRSLTGDHFGRQLFRNVKGPCFTSLRRAWYSVKGICWYRQMW